MIHRLLDSLFGMVWLSAFLNFLNSLNSLNSINSLFTLPYPPNRKLSFISQFLFVTNLLISFNKYFLLIDENPIIFCLSKELLIKPLNVPPVPTEQHI